MPARVRGFDQWKALRKPCISQVSIPVRSRRASAKGEISEVIVKTRMNEKPVWNAQTGTLFQTERCGVYVKLERNDVASVSMSYDSFSGGVRCADSTVIDGGEYCFLDNDIMIASKEADAFLMPMWRKCI